MMLLIECLYCDPLSLSLSISLFLPPSLSPFLSLSSSSAYLDKRLWSLRRAAGETGAWRSTTEQRQQDNHCSVKQSNQQFQLRSKTISSSVSLHKSQQEPALYLHTFRYLFLLIVSFSRSPFCGLTFRSELFLLFFKPHQPQPLPPTTPTFIGAELTYGIRRIGGKSSLSVFPQKCSQMTG